MKNLVFVSTSRLGDHAGMTKFLSEIPNSEGLAAILQDGKPLSTRAYDDESSCARFVTSDGAMAQCFTVTGVTIDQAEMIAAACELMEEWEPTTFQAAVEQALGADYDGTLC